MTKNWTPEPWLPKDWTGDMVMGDANYERARACVNALARVDDPRAFVDRAQKIEAHRDELVEALEEISRYAIGCRHEWTCSEIEYLGDVALAALKRAKGE